MNSIKKVRKPISLFLSIFFLLVPAFYQTVSAAMIGTGAMLAPDGSPDPRGLLGDLLSRKDIQQQLLSHGVNPAEAIARIASLSDEELAVIAPLLADLPAGGDATGFAVIVGMVIMLVAIVVEYLSDVKMLPQLYSDE